MITVKVCAHGTSHPTVLTEEDLELFTEASITVPTHDTVSMISRIYLKTHNRVITSKPASRGFLRDNSGIVYLNNAGTMCYGRLQKVLLFESASYQSRHAFAVVTCFIPTVQKLCKDSVTDCRLDDHITTLRIPRCVK